MPESPEPSIVGMDPDKLVEGLLRTYSPPEEHFTVTLPDGEGIKFRALRRYSELKNFEELAARWFLSLPKPGSAEAASHPWAEHLPKNTAEAVAAYTISELSVEPRLEHLHALKLLAAPWLIEAILQQIEEHCRTMKFITEVKLLEAAKKESETTDGGGPSSPSAETCSESIPTS